LIYVAAMPSAPAYPPPRNLLAGKTALITAAAGAGIGFSVALRAAEEGATLLISDIHERRLSEAADKIEKAVGKRPATQLCNVTQETEVQALKAAAHTAFAGAPDILINNAGLGGSASIVEMTDTQWAQVLDVSLTSVMRMCRAFLPAMYARKSGVIV